MKYYVLIILTGLIGLLHGCASTIDALSNNTSGDMIRGVKLQAGVDASSGNPVPSVSFKMGSIARKGKDDRTIMIIDNNTTNIVSESYDNWVEYQPLSASNGKKPRQIIKSEIRKSKAGQFDEGIVVYQRGSFGMPISTGNLLNLGGKTYISIGKTGANTANIIHGDGILEGAKKIVDSSTNSSATATAPANSDGSASSTIPSIPAIPTISGNSTSINTTTPTESTGTSTP